MSSVNFVPSFEQLHNNDFITATAFVAGVVETAHLMGGDTLDLPLTTLFWGTINGTLTSFMCSVICDMTPQYAKPIIPIVLLSSSIYRVGSTLYKISNAKK